MCSYSSKANNALYNKIRCGGPYVRSIVRPSASIGIFMSQNLVRIVTFVHYSGRWRPVYSSSQEGRCGKRKLLLKLYSFEFYLLYVDDLYKYTCYTIMFAFWKEVEKEVHVGVLFN